MLLLSLATQACLPTDYDNLMAIYESTSGPSWANTTGWNAETPVCEWSGITCERGTLVGIALDQVGMAGPLPEQIGCFPQLKSLYMNNNSLTGAFPEAICGLTSLQYLQAENNSLGGMLPQCLCDMSFVQFVYLSYNDFFGAIPECVGNLTFLREMHFTCNALSGSVPAAFETLPFMIELYVNCNAELDCSTIVDPAFVYLCGDVDCENCGITPQCPTCVEVPECGTYCLIA